MRTVCFALALLASVQPFGTLRAAPSEIEAQQARFDDVVRNLRNPDPKVRLSAIKLLRDAKYPEAIAPMAPLVLDPLDDVQMEGSHTGRYLRETLAVGRSNAYGASRN